MPPQINATLTGVYGQALASAETFDGPAATGPAKWEGEAPAYYREQLDRAPGAGGDDRRLARELIVDSDLSAIFASGDTVARTDDRGAHQGAIRKVRRAVLAGIPATLQTTRLSLENA